MSTIAASGPYRALVDDAAIFPPGNAPLPRAISAHREHQRAGYADLVGPFVVSDVVLPELVGVLREHPGEVLPVSVVVTGGVGAMEPAVRWANQANELDLVSVEFALRDEDDLARNARRVVTALDLLVATGQLDADTPLHVEPPRLFAQDPSRGWLGALDEIAARGLRLKFRTGGVSADAFPTSDEVATYVEAALDRELPFKATAGLHRALRHRDLEAFERPVDRHGFLNVLLATRASLDGSRPADVADLLEEADASAVVKLLGEVGHDGLVSARRWFTSFGSCSVVEPVADLVSLGLIPRLPGESV